ncbi:DNA-binding response regulator [Vallitalea longa]|uniref:Stage 0 sporulation protein A homolog n=1 Tax=Vallitalea longa TaxID=2936439 RepID=A0A9W5YF51_9FIRM|nr:response regulator [Vallitalea longa]GKX31586.1 DNA-binding response regulator [Vallitalea longa]
MKVVIADDEVLTLQLLQKIIDWESLDITIAGVAQNGIEAQDIIRKYSPQILITDIRMPKMDGLELIKWTKSFDSKIKVIILSAYGEFEYAQRALESGVVEYLLKPIDEDKLYDLVKRLKREIEEELKEQISLSSIKKIESRKIFKQLLYPCDITEINHISNIESKISDREYRLININVDNLSYDDFIKFSELKDKEIDDITDFIEMSLRKSEENINSIVTEGYFGEWMVIMGFTDDMGNDNDIIRYERITEQLIQNFSMKIGIKCYASISMPHTKVNEIYKAYYETLDLIKYRFYLGDKAVLSNNATHMKLNLKELRLIDQQKKLLEYLNTQDEKGAICLLTEIFQDINNNGALEPDKIYDFCYELIVLIRHKFCSGKINSKVLFLVEDITIEKLKTYKTLIDLKDYMISLFKNIINHLITIEEKESSRLIQKAKEYISMNYNSAITLDDICEYVSVSKSYFCYMFKREMGSSIWNYLTYYRIEKAKELLKDTDMKNYEISYSIGYENPSYFTKTFRKLTGMTPQEFKGKNYR